MRPRRRTRRPIGPTVPSRRPRATTSPAAHRERAELLVRRDERTAAHADGQPAAGHAPAKPDPALRTRCAPPSPAARRGRRRGARPTRVAIAPHAEAPAARHRPPAAAMHTRPPSRLDGLRESAAESAPELRPCDPAPTAAVGRAASACATDRRPTVERAARMRPAARVCCKAADARCDAACARQPARALAAGVRAPATISSYGLRSARAIHSSGRQPRRIARLSRDSPNGQHRRDLLAVVVPDDPCNAAASAIPFGHDPIALVRRREHHVLGGPARVERRRPFAPDHDDAPRALRRARSPARTRTQRPRDQRRRASTDEPPRLAVLRAARVTRPASRIRRAASAGARGRSAYERTSRLLTTAR